MHARVTAALALALAVAALASCGGDEDQSEPTAKTTTVTETTTSGTDANSDSDSKDGGQAEDPGAGLGDSGGIVLCRSAESGVTCLLNGDVGFQLSRQSFDFIGTIQAG